MLYWLKCLAQLVLYAGVALGIAAEIVRGEEATVPVLLDFYADWCRPCQQMAPTVEAIAREGYAVRRINVDQERDLAAKFGVSSIPCFVAMEQGKEVDRIVGQCSAESLRVLVKRRPGKIDVKVKAKAQAPTPAWRYEAATGHRAAIVRIYCQDDARTRSIGSGTLVTWRNKVVVLTARHVVKDAKSIVVELVTKKTHWAKVVSVDATWDCAVLELIGQPAGVEPATIELGPTALPRDGDRLESCGYGPDGRLACNSGLFVGYRRSEAAPNGPDDWMVISGHARGGDSGGPVFNERDCLVGVVWGYDDGKPNRQRRVAEPATIACVQAGRIHATLNAIPAKYEQRSYTPCYSPEQIGRAYPPPQPMPGFERHPTPPMPGPEPYAPLVPVPPMNGCGPNGCQPGQECEQAGLTKKPALPWRGDAEKRDASQQASIDRLIELERLKQEQADREVARQAAEEARPQPEVQPVADKPSPLLAGLCMLGAAAAGVVIYFATQKG